MKKSIFLFFAAILCAMTANAACYLKGGFNDWSTANEMAVSGTTATCTIDLAGCTTYEFKIDNGSWYGLNGTFTATSTKTLSSSAGNAKITTTIPGTYTFSFNTSTKQLTVTYPEIPVPHDITVRAQVPAHWTNDIYAHVWTSENASGQDVGPLTKNGDYYEVTKNAGALYVIFKNGSAWKDQNQTVDLCYTEDVCLQINQSGSAKATATVIECGAVSKDITVKAVVPGAWENTITAWVWPTGGEGKEVTPTKDGNWYVVTENCIELNVIFKNGTGWNGNENQTANITGVSENTCYQISALNKDGEGKCTYTVVDCEEAIEPEAKPVDVYTIVGAETLVGTAWDVNNTNNDMTKQGDGSYVLVKENVELATTGTYEYKVVKNRSWDWKGVNEGNNLTLTGVDVDGTYNVTFTLNKELNALTASLELVEAKKVIPECYVAGDESLTGQDWNAKSVSMTYDEATEVYTATLTAVPAGTHNMKVVYGGEWLGFDHLATPAPANVKEGDDKKIQFTLAEAGDVTVTYHATNGIGLTGNFAVPETKYYIAGTENLTGFDWKENGLQLTKDGDLYKHTFSALAAGTFEFKVTDGTWANTWGYNNLGAAYEEVSQGTDGEGNPNGNIKFVTEEAKNITVTFKPTTGKITIDGLTELPPAEPVTVYFINSGEWAEVACHYWGGLNGSEWPGVQMTATGETYEAEGWNVYKVTFPGDNTTCIFNDNKAEGATQTGDLEVQDGKYYCYANGIWYERLADVDPLDTRVYLKGDMNEWCANYCDMFRKETVDGTVASRTTWLEAETTYEFKIEDAGTWLSNEGTMDKDNCTGWEFTEGADNAKITTEYAGDYTFVWDMTTNQLSVEYPNPMANPEVMNLMVTDMVFDGDGTFSGTDNMMGIEFALVVGDDLGDGVYSLDASSTVNFGGTLFTDVTGMITPDTETFASASAVVYGFYMGMYFQLNVEMSAGASAGVPVEILDGTASVNGAGELTISGNWDGDDVYVVAPGFNGESYECEEVWFYVGGNDWKTASIIAFGPATITVDGNDVVVEGTVMSGMTGTNYDLFVIGTFPAAEPETPTVSGKFSTGKYEYAEFALGNLQYNVGTDTWAFAANQYEVIGEANINLGDPTFTGTIDMFGWSTDDEGNNYGVNPNNVNELYDGTFQDWGTKMGEGWSTLSADQWKYLLNTRNNAKNLKQIARVGSVVGIMLFPDNWNEAPVVDAEYDSDFEVNIYNYDLAQWANLEDNGAVFLPAAGRRAGGYGNMTNKDQNEENNSANLNDGYYRWQDNTNIYCYYWTSTINETTKDVAYLHNITYLGNDEYTIGTGAVWSEKGRYGQSVRLAKVTDVTPDYTRTTTAGKFGTICLPFGSTNYTGMELFECVGQETGKVYIASVTTLEAGVPYIFLATGTELAVYSDGTTAATPGDHNGLHGTFTDDTEVAVGNYILKDNALCQAATTCWVNANRAYLVMGEVPTEPVQQMPGRRYIGMSTKGENAATGLDNITNGENSVIKTIENGQLIIIRNGEKFNAQGVRF